MNKVISILALLADLLVRFLKQKENREHENESRKIEEDPGTWFDKHFNGGVRKHEPNLPRDSPSTSETSSGKSENQ
jgi:hypothetical protein